MSIIRATNAADCWTVDNTPILRLFRLEKIDEMELDRIELAEWYMSKMMRCEGVRTTANAISCCQFRVTSLRFLCWLRHWKKNAQFLRKSHQVFPLLYFLSPSSCRLTAFVQSMLRNASGLPCIQTSTSNIDRFSSSQFSLNYLVSSILCLSMENDGFPRMNFVISLA